MKVTINGATYNIEGTDDPELAVKHAHEFAQQDLNKKAQTEFNDAGMLSKPFMAVQDVVRTAADTLSGGYADKMTDYMKPPIPGEPSQAQITKAIRSRMSGADIGADAALAVAAAPTAVPRVVGMLGGGTIARGVTGLAAAAGEGGVLGGISAAGHDQPVGEGVVQGALAGTGGQAVAKAVTKPVNAVANWWSGANKALPPLTKEQFARASKFVGDDPATKAFSAVGNVADKIPGMAALISLPHYMSAKAGGKVSDFIADQGRREKVDAAIRAHMGQPRVKGPLADDERLALGMRGRLYDYFNEGQ